MSPEDHAIRAAGELVARSMARSARAGLQDRLQAIALTAAEIDVPGDTLDGWFEEAREAFRRRRRELTDARDGVR